MQTGEKLSMLGEQVTVPGTLDQLGKIAQQLLNDKDLEVSKVRPFFWSLVETYVDRFQLYPFDISKALLCHFELQAYPAEELTKLIEQLEQQYEKFHGRALYAMDKKSLLPIGQEDETDILKSCLQYAAMLDNR